MSTSYVLRNKMEKAKSHPQKQQEEEYKFPYHYIPQYKSYFTQTYNLDWGISYSGMIEFLLGKLKEEDFQSLADIGTGDGRIAAEIAYEFYQKDIVGIDYSEHAIALAKAMNPSLNFLCTDITTDTSGKKYDCITLIEVFEHIPPASADNFVKALYSILEENGFVLLTVPHKNITLTPKHFQHFSSEEIKEYFKSYFVIEEEILFEKQSLITNIIKRFMTNRYFILNHRKLKNIVYSYYKGKLFYADEKNCGRVFLKLRKK